MTDLENAVEFAQNLEPRCACVLLVDTVNSMSGQPITALNEGLRAFADDICNDVLARQPAEIAVVIFGGTVPTVQDFLSAGSFDPPWLSAHERPDYLVADKDYRHCRGLLRRRGINYTIPHSDQRARRRADRRRLIGSGIGSQRRGAAGEPAQAAAGGRHPLRQGYRQLPRRGSSPR